MLWKKTDTCDASYPVRRGYDEAILPYAEHVFDRVEGRVEAITICDWYYYRHNTFSYQHIILAVKLLFHPKSQVRVSYGGGIIDQESKGNQVDCLASIVRRGGAVFL